MSSNVCSLVCAGGSFGPDGGPCTLCPAGTYKASPGTAVCRDTCPANSTSPEGSTSADECVCSMGFYSFSGLFATNCTSCARGSYRVLSGQDECSACEPAKYKETVGPGVCALCPPSSSSMSGSSEATDCACNSNFFGANGAACTPCLAASSAPSGSVDASACTCNAGYSGLGNGSSACTACEAGWFKSTPGSAECQCCPAYSNLPSVSTDHAACWCNAGYTDSGQLCTACEIGTYKLELGSQPCAACPAGKYKTDTGPGPCAACGSNSDSPVGSYRAAYCRCKQGFTGDNGGTCSQCNAGTYKIAAGDDACTWCVAGKYSSNFRAITEAACLNCAVGTSSSLVGAVSSASCQQCESGKYSAVPASEICANCVAGKHSSEVGASSEATCSSCVRGKYSSNPGATSHTTCVDCMAGKYLPFPASMTESDCKECDAGTFSPRVGAAEEVTCQACPPGSTAMESSDAITDCRCEPGFSGSDGGPCLQCAAGTYKAGSGPAVCDACLPNSNAPLGSTTSTACTCNAGCTGPAGGTCVQCIAGKYKIAPGEAACDNCTAGQYSTAVGAASDVCQRCPTNSDASEASDQEVDCTCNAGYTSESGVCAACETGTYKSEPGSLPCDPCPTDSISPVASVLPTSCICKVGYAGINRTSCAPCESGKYKLSVGFGLCTICPMGTEKDFTGPGTCMPITRPAIVVSLVIGLPITLKEFDEQKQQSFRQGLARAAGVVVSDVRILNIEPVSGSRRLLSESISIEVEIAAKDNTAAEAMAGNLDADSINKQMLEVGLPAATIIEGATVKSVATESPSPENGNVPSSQDLMITGPAPAASSKKFELWYIGIIIGVVVLTIIYFVIMLYRRQRTKRCVDPPIIPEEAPGATSSSLRTRLNYDLSDRQSPSANVDPQQLEQWQTIDSDENITGGDNMLPEASDDISAIHLQPADNFSVKAQQPLYTSPGNISSSLRERLNPAGKHNEDSQTMPIQNKQISAHGGNENESIQHSSGGGIENNVPGIENSTTLPTASPAVLAQRPVSAQSTMPAMLTASLQVYPHSTVQHYEIHPSSIEISVPNLPSTTASLGFDRRALHVARQSKIEDGVYKGDIVEDLEADNNEEQYDAMQAGSATKHAFNYQAAETMGLQNAIKAKLQAAKDVVKSVTDWRQ